MFKKILENIRNKPEHVKKSIAFFSSLAITSVVALFWVVSYINYSTEVLSKKDTENQTASAIDALGQKISGSYDRIRGQFNIGDIVGGEKEAVSQDVGIVATSTATEYIEYNGVIAETPADNTYTTEDEATTSSEVLVQ